MVTWLWIVVAAAILVIFFLTRRPESSSVPLVTDAKKHYRQFLETHTNLDRDDISEHVTMFAEEVKEAIADHKIDARDSDEDAKEARKRIATIKTKLNSVPNDEDLQEELSFAEDELAEFLRSKQESLDDAKALRQDKRAFLVDYINREFHGPDWQDKGIATKQ